LPIGLRPIGANGRIQAAGGVRFFRRDQTIGGLPLPRSASKRRQVSETIRRLSRGISRDSTRERLSLIALAQLAMRAPFTMVWPFAARLIFSSPLGRPKSGPRLNLLSQMNAQFHFQPIKLA